MRTTAAYSGELCKHLNMTRQSVTLHLNVLEAANLVVTVRRGRERLHFVNPVPLRELYDCRIAKFEKPCPNSLLETGEAAVRDR